MATPPTRLEIVIGRAAAMCVHPQAAWRVGTKAARTWVVFAYLAVSYVIVFGALELILSSTPKS